MVTEIKDRFYLKSFSIGYEVPIFDLSDTEALQDLALRLSKAKKTLIESLSSSIEFFKFGELPESEEEIPNLPKIIEENNILFLFSIVVRIDSNIVNPIEFKENWNQLKSNIETAMTGFFESKKLIFRILKEYDL